MDFTAKDVRKLLNALIISTKKLEKNETELLSHRRTLQYSPSTKLNPAN